MIAACGSESNSITQPDAGTEPDAAITQPDVDVESNADVPQDAGVSFSCVLDEEAFAAEGAVPIVPSEVAVHDGDTMKDRAGEYRFSAVDAAECEACFSDETGWPDQHGVGSDSEVNHCEEGRDYTNVAIHGARHVWKVPGRLDEYGRRLAYIVVDMGDGRKQLLNCLLVRDGEAWQTVSHWGPGSHPPLAQMVLDASEYAGPPYFEEPWLWKEPYQHTQREECQNQ